MRLAPAQPLARVPKKFPGFGYVCDPKIGGEETVLEYRHSGAWVLKTKVCDEKTLEFLVRNHISILLVLDGSREKINADLKRIYHDIDKLEKTKMNVTHFAKRYEAYQPFALAALLVLLAEILLRITWLRRIP